MVQQCGWRLVAGATAGVTGAIALACVLSAWSSTTAMPDPSAQRAATPVRVTVTPAAATWADPSRSACGLPTDGSPRCALGVCVPVSAWSFDLPLQPMSPLTAPAVMTA